MKKFLCIAGLILFIPTMYGQSCHESGPEPHAMAPIGVMGGHTHSKGHFMASYRYMTMNMSGLSSCGTKLESSAVLSNAMMAPTDMQMQMHMVGIMYAPIDRVTLSVMGAYLNTGMGMVSESNHASEMTHDHSAMVDMDDQSEEPLELTSSSMRNQGFGDTKIAALIRLNQHEKHCIHAISGVRLPTGGVTAGDEMHPVLPYAMQNGTGSVGAFLGLNYSWLTAKYLLGTQVLSNAPLHENKRGYMQSVSHDANIWVARKWASWVSSSVRLHGRYQTGIRGADMLIDPMMSPAGNGANEALHYLDVSGGINLRPFDQWRIGLEAGYPFYQFNEGVHLDQAWNTTLGLQFMMH